MQGEDSSNQGGFVSALDLPDVPSANLPPHLELRRTRVLCNADAPDNTDTIQYSGAYSWMGIDNSLRLDEFCNNFKVKVNRLTNDEMEFDMVDVDPSLANAFRRILLSELPTMAIEKVVLNEDIKGDMAEEIVKKCPANVFDIEELANGKKRASVARPRACTLCRECIREGEEWERR